MPKKINKNSASRWCALSGNTSRFSVPTTAYKEALRTTLSNATMQYKPITNSNSYTAMSAPIDKSLTCVESTWQEESSNSYTVYPSDGYADHLVCKLCKVEPCACVQGSA